MATRLHRRDVLALVAATVAGIPALGHARAVRPCLDDLLGRRRMVRRFTDAPVPAAQVRRLLRAANRAPSAGNTRPWAFVVARAARRRRALARAALGQDFVAAAPVVIVACADARRSRARYAVRGDLYAVVDTAFAAMLLLLAAVEERLGACFVGALDEDAVRRVLRLPAAVRPLAVIPIGHPAESPPAQELRALDAVIHDETW